MGDLLKCALADGFKIALLESWRERARGLLAVQAKLFDGGRQINSIRYIPQRTTVSLPVQPLSKLLHQVMAPPHLLVTYGIEWMALLHALFAERVSLFRILNLHDTAVALRTSLSTRASTAAILKAFAVPHCDDDFLFFTDAVEQLLWAVIAEADKRAFSLDDLLRCAELARHRADFSSCDFDENTLKSLPAVPGVYAMYDDRDRLLYVGKSVNLRRRLSEYFAPSVHLPEKIARIRAQIHHLAYQTVGSELEALLLENRMIESAQPTINIQKNVAEGRSRYAAPFLPIIIITRSTRTGWADLFIFDARRHAYQFSFSPEKRSAPVSLNRLMAHFLEDGPPPRSHRMLRDWGTVGGEICRRFFARNRARINWCELTASFWYTNGWNSLKEMARAALGEPAWPAEFRDE